MHSELVSRTIGHETDIAKLNFANGNGLLPVAVQHYATGELLMIGYADAEALRRTLASGQLWLYSRSRQEYWHKGATSGHTQRVVSMHADCDADAVLVRVKPVGPICHTGTRSCFDGVPVLRELAAVIEERMQRPSVGSYTSRLLNDANLRAKKLGEEAVELAVACAKGDREQVVEESCDLIYHTLVASVAAGVSLDEILGALHARRS